VLFLTFPSLGPYKIPTWTSPLVACVVVSVLLSNVSFLGHMCAILVGYLREFPSVSVLLHHLIVASRSRIPQGLCAPREDPPLDRGQAKPPRTPSSLRFCGSKDLRSLWSPSNCQQPRRRQRKRDTFELHGIHTAPGSLILMTHSSLPFLMYILDHSSFYSEADMGGIG
jgi:hypothetical protein